MFVVRKKELDFPKILLERTHPGPAQFVPMYGRRRVGKSELLLQWARQSGCKTTYWEAVKESSTQQRVRLFGKLLNVHSALAPVYHSWGTGKVGRSIMSELIDRKMPLVIRDLPDQGEGWKTYYALFARKGFTSATIEEASKRQCLLVELTRIDQMLGHADN